MNTLLDGDHYKTVQLVDTLMANANVQANLDLIEALKPKFFQDGNKFCYLYGELPNDCVVGYGDTAYEAMCDFSKCFFTGKPAKQNP